MLATGGLRALLVTFGAALATCSAPQRGNTTPAAPAAAQEAEPAPEPARTFDPDVVRAEDGSPIDRVRHALTEGAPELAAQLAAPALAEAEGAEAGRLRWLLARAQMDAGQPVVAFETLAPLAAAADQPLAPWARLLRARLLMEGEHAEAVEEVAPLLDLEWAGRVRAQELHAAALVAAEDEGAEPALRALLEAADPDSARASVALPLAELLAAREDVDARVEAIGLLRRVASRAPLTPQGRDAAARADAIVAELPRARRRALTELTPEQAFDRAEALARAMRFADAEEAFADVAERSRDEALTCRARYGQGRAIYYRRQRRRAAEHLADVARDCDALEVRAWAYYLAGKGFTSAGEPELALAQYARLEEQATAHSLADDARYLGALIHRDQGDEERMVERLTSLPEDYPQGDMRGRARFMLAWRARRAGDAATALTHLDALIREGIGEDREDLAGRARYWRGCVLAEEGRAEEATESWTATVAEAPLSYYAQQALVRLQETDEAAATAARAQLGERSDGAIRFAWRPELETDAFTRALELLRVGEFADAQSELAWIRAQSDESDAELTWIEAALLDRVGEHSRAVYLTRRHLRDFMDEPPADAHFARWRIAFPRAFAGPIERAAEEQPVPPELIWAIAREESSFRPDVVSVAHAYGLTQLILPTARRFGRALSLRPTPTTLRDPMINARIGAAYMGWLWNRYEENPVVLPSAYNAGQGATDRWLRERPDQRLDEWIEEIPYDETRRYTRRVLQTWGIYTWLNRGELPALPARLPRR